MAERRTEAGPNGPSRWLLVVLVCVLGMAVAAASALGGSAPGKRDRPDKQLAKRALKASANPAIRRATERAKRRHARRMAARRTPRAKMQRLRSRVAHMGKSDRAALKLARTTFDRLINEPAWNAPNLERGEHVKRFVGQNGAVVDNPSSPRDLYVESTEPIATKSADGDLRGIDMKLRRSGAGLAPKNARAKFRFGTSARKAVRFGKSGIGIGVPGAKRKRNSATVGGKVFYGNSGRDTDFIAAPLDSGVETFFQIRSYDSPEDPSLDFDLPPGVKLHLTQVPQGGPKAPSGLAEVRRGKRVLMKVAPAFALDADGRTVPVTYAVDGDRLVLKVPHRSSDYRYPILVDPQVVETFNPTGRYNYSGWQSGSWWGGWNLNTTPWWGYEGLYAYTNPGWTYQNDEWGHFFWRAYGDTTIVRADFAQVHNVPAYDQGNPWAGCALVGLMSAGGAWERWAQVCDDARNWHAEMCLVNGCAPTWDSPNNVALFRGQIWNTGARPAQHTATASQAVFVLHDFKQPFWQSASHSGAGSNGHWAHSGNGHIYVQAKDNGLGMRQLSGIFPRSNGTNATDARTRECTTNNRAGGARTQSPCALEMGETFTYDISLSPEGESTPSFGAADLVNNGIGNYVPFNIKKDTQAPTTTSRTGALQNGGRWIGVGGADMTVAMNDTHAGLRPLSAQVGGTALPVVGSAQPGPSCDTASCQSWRNRTVTFRWTPTSTQAETAPDAAGYGASFTGQDPIGGASHTRTEQWNVKFEKTDPKHPGPNSGTLARGWFTEGPQTLTVPTRDDHSGVANVKMYVDDALNPNDSRQLVQTVGGSCGAASCTRDKTANFEWTPNSWLDVNVTVVTTDFVGETFEESWVVRRDPADPVVTPTGGLRATPSTAGRDLHINATDARSGVAKLRVWVDPDSTPTDDEAAYTKDYACDPAGSCPLLVDEDWALPGSVPAGQHEFLVRAVDAAGRKDEERWTTLIDEEGPDLQTGGPLTEQPFATSRRLDASAEDASGISKFVIWVDPDTDPTEGEAAHVQTYVCPPACNETESIEWDLPATVPDGPHAFLVRVYDRHGTYSDETWSTTVDGADPEVDVTGDLRREPATTGRGLHVEASDATAGVDKVLIWADPDADPSENEAIHVRDACPDPACPTADAFDWTAPASVAEGEHDFLIRVIDAAGRTRDESWTTVVDDQAPGLEVSGGLRATPVASGRDLTLSSTDSGSGIDKLIVWVDPDADPVEGEAAHVKPCGAASSCTDSWQLPDGYEDGQHRYLVRAVDSAGRSTDVAWENDLDSRDPVLELSGTLRPPIATGRRLDMKGTDSSGIASFHIWLDPDADPTVDEASAKTYGCPPGCTSPQNHTWVMPQSTPEGEHTILVRVTDGHGRTTDESFEVRVVNILPTDDRSKLGLEHWFQYDDTPANNESQVFVNAETGNAVWHKVPIVNRGRGLSSVVNLTYNSQDRAGVFGQLLGDTPLLEIGAANLAADLPGLSYGEAGVGFSVAVSGPTRLNEPLTGVRVAEAVEEVETIAGVELPALTDLKIQLTDADGTQHTFTRGQNGWVAPPGVDLHLRRYANDNPANPLAIVPDKWAMTRPDGVTHFFDSLGYITRSEDRNGNTLRYVYEYYDAVSGVLIAPGVLAEHGAQPPNECQLFELVERNAVPWICAKRVSAVVDAGERELKVDYRKRDNGLPLPITEARKLDVGAVARAYFPGIVGGRAGRIDKITDHAGREYRFGYDSDGFLTQFTEAAGKPDQRVTRFGYEDWKPGIAHLGQDRQMVTVDGGTDQPRTVIRYVHEDDRAAIPPVEGVPNVPPSPLAKPRQVCGVTKRVDAETTSTPAPVTGKMCRSARSDRETTYDYRERSDSAPAQLTVTEVLNRGPAGRRTATTKHELDQLGRPTAVVDPRNVRTELGWSANDNAVAHIEKAAGTPDAARTEMTYDTEHGTGMLESKTEYPDYQSTSSKGTARTTEFDYEFANGVHRSTADGVNDGDAVFVADLTEIRRPKSGTGSSFRIAQDAAGNYLGLVDRMWEKPGRAGPFAQTSYDANGSITSETDLGNRTTVYSNHDDAGQPQTVVDPRNSTWTYRYTASGEVKHVVDPRGGTGEPAEGSAYTTTVDYDSFDRPVREHLPKLSAGSVAAERFITKRREYDADGNVEWSTDGNTKRTDIEYTAAGMAKRVKAPREGGAEVTDYVYDDADRLIARVAPLGTGSTVATDPTHDAICDGTTPAPETRYMTRYCLDDVGRRVAEIRTAGAADRQAGDPAATVKAFAYDNRDNLRAIVDPKRTSGKTVPQALAIAQRRWNDGNGPPRYDIVFDKLDRRTFMVESAITKDASGNLTGTWRGVSWHYDANGNLERLRPYRSYEFGFNPNDAYSTRYFYDDQDRPVAERGPRGCTATLRNPDGSVKSVTTPSGTAGAPDNCGTAASYTHYTTRYTYDEAGDLKTRSIPFAPRQYDRQDSEFEKWKVTYERDEVGNPKTITDARGNAFTNTYYDGGELRSTDRPSWFQLKWPGGHENPADGRNFRETSSPVDLEIGDGGPQLAEAEGRSRNAARSGQTPEFPKSDAAGDFAEVDPEALGDLLPDAGETEFRYDGEMRLKGVTDDTGGDYAIDYDDAGRVTRKQWPFKADTPISHEYAYDLNGRLKTFENGEGDTTTFDYDGFDRRTFERAPGAHEDPAATGTPQQEVTNFRYDVNDNVEFRTTPRGSRTASTTDFRFAFAYDAWDRLVEESNPVGERWSYGLDVADNVKFERSPRWHTAAAADKAKYQVDYTFTPANDMATKTRGFGEVRKLDFVYDAEGHLAWWNEFPTADNEGQAPQLRVRFNLRDGRGLTWREGGWSQGTDDARATTTEWDANGNLRRKTDGIGTHVGNDGMPKVKDMTGVDDGRTHDAKVKDATWHATLHEYDKDDQRTTTWLPWSKPGGTGTAVPSGPNDAEAGGDDTRYKQELDRPEEGNPLRRVRSIISPYDIDKSKAPRTSYTYYANGWIATLSEEKIADPATSAPVRERLVTYDYDRTGNQTSWVTANHNKPSGRTVTRSFWPNGMLRQRVGTKNQPETENAPDQETVRCHGYGYNPNRSLTQIDDYMVRTAEDSGKEARRSCPRTKSRSTLISRDGAERETLVQEDWDGGRDTTFGYDANGNVRSRKTDGNVSGADYVGEDAKVATFNVDPLDRETHAVIDPVGAGRTRTTTTEWWDSGDIKTRTKPNGTVESRWYDGWGQPTKKKRDPKPVGGDDAVTHTYDHDRNGNRLEDERGKHVFNPRNQLVEWTRSDKYEGKEGDKVKYERNGSGDITKKTDEYEPEGATSPTVTTNHYLGERLRYSVTERQTTGGEDKLRSDYLYDDFGSIIRIDHDQIGPGPDPEEPADGVVSPSNCEEVPNNAEADVTRYCFDEFERMTLSRGQGVEKPTRFAYDGLDRRDSKTVEENGEPKRHDYSYVGTSKMLTRETDKNGKRKTYDYDSNGRRLGQTVTNPDGDRPAGCAADDGDAPDTCHRSYALDVNGSVEGLEDHEGKVKETDSYRYDPYGENDKVVAPDAQDDGDQGLSDEAQENPFRFEGFYFDSGVKTYDMEARNYRSDVGRFLSQDRYESAAGDQILQADPLTQNRYAFAGGNPVNNVEFDGHHHRCRGPQGLGAACGGGSNGNVRRVKHSRPRGRRPQAPAAAAPAPAPAPAPAAGPAVWPTAAPFLPVTALRTGGSLGMIAGIAVNKPPPKEEKKDDGGGFFSWGTVWTGYRYINSMSPAMMAYNTIDAGLEAKESAENGDYVPAATMVASLAIGRGAGGNATRQIVPRLRSLTRLTRRGGSKKGCSFVRGTPVTMADGRRMPIERLRSGHRVLATDPVTGRSGGRVVTRLIVGAATKRLVALTIGGSTTVATQNHPVWSETDRRWTPAGKLATGDVVRTAGGGTAVVQHVQRYSSLRAKVFNLTVDELHTYHVGAASFLVHNQDTCSAFSEQPHSLEPGSRATLRSRHRRQANRGLERDLVSDPAFRQRMDAEVGYDLLAYMRTGKSGLLNPRGMEWHHPLGRWGHVQLLTRADHRNPALQRRLHSGPNNGGGMAAMNP